MYYPFLIFSFALSHTHTFSLSPLQPSIAGHDQAGISETVEFVLKKYPEKVQVRGLNKFSLHTQE